MPVHTASGFTKYPRIAFLQPYAGASSAGVYNLLMSHIYHFNYIRVSVNQVASKGIVYSSQKIDNLLCEYAWQS